MKRSQLAGDKIVGMAIIGLLLFSSRLVATSGQLSTCIPGTTTFGSVIVPTSGIITGMTLTWVSGTIFHSPLSTMVGRFGSSCCGLFVYVTRSNSARTIMFPSSGTTGWSGNYGNSAGGFYLMSNYPNNAVSAATLEFNGPSHTVTAGEVIRFYLCETYTGYTTSDNGGQTCVNVEFHYQSSDPTTTPSSHPSLSPSFSPSKLPSLSPTQSPSTHPSMTPSMNPSSSPSMSPTPCPCRAIMYPSGATANLPQIAIRVVLNEVTLELELEVDVEKVCPDTMYYIDFDQFDTADDATSGDKRGIFSTTNCENRASAQFNQNLNWADVWNPVDLNTFDSMDNLLLPPTSGSKWTLTRKNCTTFTYSATFSWADLVGCKAKDGTTSTLSSTSTTSQVRLAGSLIVTAVAPRNGMTYFTTDASHNYFTRELGRHDIDMMVHRNVYSLSDGTNREIIYGTVLREDIEDVDASDPLGDRVNFVVFTETGQFLKLSPTGSSVLTYHNSDSSSERINDMPLSVTVTAIHGSDTCLSGNTGTNADTLCWNTWKLDFPRLSVPAANGCSPSNPRDYSGTLKVRFTALCRSASYAATCDSFSNVQFSSPSFPAAGVNLEVDLNVFLQELSCPESSASVTPNVITTIYVDSDFNSQVTDSTFEFTRGQEVFVEVRIDDSNLDLTSFLNFYPSGYVLYNLKACTTDGGPETFTMLNPPDTIGGCFQPSGSVDAPVVDLIMNGVSSTIWNLNVILEEPTRTRFSIIPDFSFARSAFYINSQLRLDLTPASSVRRMRSLMAAGGVSGFGPPNTYSFSGSSVRVTAGGGSSAQGMGSAGEALSQGGLIGVIAGGSVVGIACVIMMIVLVVKMGGGHKICEFSSDDDEADAAMNIQLGVTGDGADLHEPEFEP